MTCRVIVTSVMHWDVVYVITIMETVGTALGTTVKPRGGYYLAAFYHATSCGPRSLAESLDPPHR